MSEKNCNSLPALPKRAIITAGMPYGNKGLHFGHIGGVFVQADFYARYLRDRIGRENVIFVSGTDCYGSPIVEGFRKIKESGEAEKLGINTIEEFVNYHHNNQKKTIEDYEVELDIYAGSALEPAVPYHHAMSKDVLNTLADNGTLKPETTRQFFDEEEGIFLNGRQVLGHCPVEGCKSEKAYADECDMGHQFLPEELIDPISAISGKKPTLKETVNWYFDLPAYQDFLISEVERMKKDERVRDIVVQTCSEFLGAPTIYIKEELLDDYKEIAEKLPEHTFIPADDDKQSFSLEFKDYKDRDIARDILNEADIWMRTGKALVPFRLTGNVDWGVPTPDREGMEDQTVWVWPESLWAPISFTQTVLESDACKDNVKTTDKWEDFWESDDATVFQFIGQDNIYFYCVAQPAMFEALGWGLKPTIAVANHHLLFLDKKASSSGKVKPPMAHDLLNYYTPEQLRCHWLALGLDQKSVSFSPKVYDPENKDNKRAADPVLKEGALLTNIFNRLARSCFYGAKKHTDLKLPKDGPSNEVFDKAKETIFEFEKFVRTFEFHRAFGVCDEYIRDANKRWSDAMNDANELEGSTRSEAIVKALKDSFFELHVASVLMHPAAPVGTEKICEYFNIEKEKFFSWDNILCTLNELAKLAGNEPGEHTVQKLPPRTDFFERHPSQL